MGGVGVLVGRDILFFTEITQMKNNCVFVRWDGVGIGLQRVQCNSNHSSGSGQDTTRGILCQIV